MKRTTAHIHRDPRAVAVSACYHLHQEADLDAVCASATRTTALWMRFRQAWFSDRARDVAYDIPCASPRAPPPHGRGARVSGRS